MNRSGHLIFIAGPTASGKSSLAVRLAKALHGEIINADALQVYEPLNLLSARPSEEEQEGISHHLFGTFSGDQSCSAGIWARLAAPLIDQILARQHSAIVVGGTGLYFKALETGLSPIPDPGDSVRAIAEARYEEVGPHAFREEVVANDPALDWIEPADRQRLVRAWSVAHATGQPLSTFQAMPAESPLRHKISARIKLIPPREALYANCEMRFDNMIEQGALDEAHQIAQLDLDPALPMMKALGLAELLDHIHGQISLEEATALAKRNTRRFAKRQMTWLRGQAQGWPQAETGEEALRLLLDQLGGGGRE